MAPRTKLLFESTQSKRCGLLRTPSKSLLDCRPAHRFSNLGCHRKRTSKPSAFQRQLNSQTRNRTRVRMTVQTEVSSAASLSAAGSVNRRIVRAQRCSIKVLICSTTALPAKRCPGSNWSLRAVAGSSFVRSKCAVWPASVSRRSPAVHTPNASGHPPRRNSLTPRPSLRRNRARRVAPSEYPTCAAT